MNNPTLVEQIDGVILHISDVLYRPWFLPVFLIVGGLIFTFATKFVQVRLFPEAIKVIKEKPKNENGISSFGALMVSTASRVGTGNIIGVSTAICCGGPGAIFWMWITAFFGGASALSNQLSHRFTRREILMVPATADLLSICRTLSSRDGSALSSQ